MEQVGNQADSVSRTATSRERGYDSLNSPGEWATVFFVILVSFIITWYGIQYLYTPTPRSETPAVVDAYKRQGCTRHPGEASPPYIPGNLLIWEDGRGDTGRGDTGRLRYVPFDSFDHQIVLFCP